MKIKPVILAAGKGTRMKSSLTKTLHPVLGRPMVWYSVTAARQVTGSDPVVVIGEDTHSYKNALGDGVEFVIQEQRLGTGHAVQQTEAVLKGNADLILVLLADMPLIRPETLSQIIETQQHNDGPMTLLTVELDDPHGFGRIIRNANGEVTAIVEEVQATEAQRKIRELNASLYCISASWLWDALSRIEISPKGEYYLTDLVAIAVKDGLSVQSIKLDDPMEMIGVNNRIHLSEATMLMQHRINSEWMLSGVTIIDPASTYIERGVKIGKDTTIWPNTYLQGETSIGASCTLGPNTIVRDTQMGNHCEIFSSVLESAVLEDNVDIGPYGHLRTGAHLGAGVHMGNFGEVKDSYLGPGTKMGHFSYLGDATTGENVNIGAGTITCNYDGEKKHPTKIGDDVFIGSDTMLVAPLDLGDGSRTGAGSVVTKDVKEDTLVVGIPARAIRKIHKRK
jgi:bifunctional UDP-N-acetylglucosamine pyrophosphorylase/glucosamine-1-phosphate N-acetyltransferase